MTNSLSGKCVAFVVLSFLCLGCSKKPVEPEPSPVGSVPDKVLPRPILDFKITDRNDSSATFTWTAPADRDNGEPVTAYDLRGLINEPINRDKWNRSHEITGLPVPSAPGDTQTFSLPAWSLWGKYYFAIRASDSAGNWSWPSPNDSIVWNFPIPTRTTDLTIDSVSLTTVQLSWTVASDTGVNRPIGYDLRFDTAMIKDANWANASQPFGPLEPQEPGATMEATVSGLDYGTDYFFALKAEDRLGRKSVLSNVAHTQTLTPSPEVITDLSISNVDSTSMTLTWSALDDTGLIRAVAYDLRYDTIPVTDSNWATSVSATNLPTPGPVGSTEELLVENLLPGTTYYFAIKTQSVAGYWSALSNETSAKTIMAVEWIKTFDLGGNEMPADIVALSDGSVVIAGRTDWQTAGGDDMSLVKISPEGEVVWAQTFGGADEDYAVALIQSSDGGFVIVGNTSSFGGGGMDVYVVKTDLEGILTWQQTYGGAGLDNATGAVEDKTGTGYVIVGSTASDVDFASSWLFKIGQSGSLVWERIFETRPECGSIARSSANDIANTNDGNYAIALTSFSSIYDYPSMECNLWWSFAHARVYDEEGQRIWSRLEAGGRRQEGSQIAVGPDGSVVLISHLVLLEGYQVFQYIDGSKQWGLFLDLSMAVTDLITTSSGTLVITGYGYSVGSLATRSTSVGLLHQDGSYAGKFDWDLGLKESATAVVQMSSGDLAICGWVETEPDNLDIVLIKLKSGL